jgi:hypothetical protein
VEKRIKAVCARMGWSFDSPGDDGARSRNSGDDGGRSNPFPSSPQSATGCVAPSARPRFPNPLSGRRRGIA